MASTERIIVAGSRDFDDYAYFREKFLEYLSKFKDKSITIVTGRAPNGPDDMAYHFAKWDQPCNLREFKADWDTHGKRAGFIRNEEMAEFGSCLFAIHDGESKGTKHMIETARSERLPLKLFVVDPPEEPMCEILHYDV